MSVLEVDGHKTSGPSHNPTETFVLLIDTCTCSGIRGLIAIQTNH